jgi:DNA-directed RNA polymerase specialized sigma24 family protein
VQTVDASSASARRVVKRFSTNRRKAQAFRLNLRHLPFMPETSLDQLLAQRKKFMAFLQRRVPDAALAEDILQTAYLRAYKHKDNVEPGEPAVAWFYRLLRNAVIDNFRRQETRNKAL